MFSASVKRSGSDMDAFLKRVSEYDPRSSLEKLAKEGVDSLSKATPLDEGTTAAAWTYEIVKEKNGYSVIWNNTNVQNGTPIAILLQYGHGTRTGGYVPGRDFINPALKPVFDKMTAEMWKVVQTR